MTASFRKPAVISRCLKIKRKRFVEHPAEFLESLVVRIRRTYRDHQVYPTISLMKKMILMKFKVIWSHCQIVETPGQNRSVEMISVFVLSSSWLCLPPWQLDWDKVSGNNLGWTTWLSLPVSVIHPHSSLLLLWHFPMPKNPAQKKYREYWAKEESEPQSLRAPKLSLEDSRSWE